MIGERQFYKIGKIGRPHGICGEVLFMFTDDVFDTTDADHLMLQIDGLLVPFFMEEYRFKSDETAIVKFEDIDSKEQAQIITNCEVWFPREAAEAADHYSLDQLVGYTVISVPDNSASVPENSTSYPNNSPSIPDSLASVPDGSASVPDGSVVGRIQSIDTSTENYLFEILTQQGEEALIPIVNDWVKDIDHNKRTITLTLPEGLL